DDAAKNDRTATALNQILDLELAIMLETYREDLEAKHRNNERLATIGQFAASIGHELRNPLGVMESSLYLLRQHLRAEADAPAVKKHLDRIGGEVQRANKTIHDLLDLARNRPPQKRATRLGELVDSAAEAALLPAALTLHASLPADFTVTVDADEALSENLAEIVQELGVETAITRDRKSALALAAQRDFDVALIDVRLPDGDGMSLLAPLRERSPHLQAVMVTGNASVEGAIAAVRGAVFAYVLKPVSPPDLLDTARRALDQAALFREQERLRRELQSSEQRHR